MVLFLENWQTMNILAMASLLLSDPADKIKESSHKDFFLKNLQKAYIMKCYQNSMR